MAISRVHIENFKGFSGGVDVEIKPITLFIGANSSGKSSCIHALACLAQTVKVSNSDTPLVLDDEFANVHLGRFVEVAHSRSYQDVITLGVGIDSASYLELLRVKDGEEIRGRRAKGTINARYSFKCTKRTQNIDISEAELTAGKVSFQLKKSSPGHYVLSLPGSKISAKVKRDSAFFVDVGSMLVGNSAGDFAIFEQTMPLRSAQETLKNELQKTLYLGPFRQAPVRGYSTRGSFPAEVGAQGESTITILANETIQSQSRPHLKQIAGWLSTLGLAKTVDVARVARSDIFDVKIGMEDGDKFPLADLGYGLSQILPVLTQCSFAPTGSTLLFEQPEIHLHTAASRNLASVFIETVKDKKCRILAETHSPELVKQCFQEVKKGNIRPEDLVVYKVQRTDGESRIEAIDVDEYGDVYENWEHGISVD